MMNLILTVSTVNNWEQLFTLSFLTLFLKVTSIIELMKSFWLWPYWKTDRNSLVTSFPSIHKHQHKAKANIEHFQCYLGLWYLAIDKMKLWQKFLVYAVFPATLLKKRLWHRCFTNFFEKHILYRTPPGNWFFRVFISKTIYCHWKQKYSKGSSEK